MKNWEKCKITELFFEENIVACSKFAAELTLNALCYWIKHLGKKTIFIFIFGFTNSLYKLDDSFFLTLHRFSIILANIEGRIKIKDISNSAWPGLLQNTNYFIPRCPQT